MASGNEPASDGQKTKPTSDELADKSTGDKIDSASKASDEPSDSGLVEKLKKESESRKAKLAEKEKLLGEQGVKIETLSTQIKQLTSILTGGEVKEDSALDPDAAVSEFKKSQELLESHFKATLLKSSFVVAATKAGFVDPDVAFLMVDKNDSQLKVSLETQQVEGMDTVVQSLLKKAPWVLGKKDSDKPPTDSMAAPGSPSPSDRSSSSSSEAVSAIAKEAEKIGGVDGATYYLNEMAKLKKKA